MQIKTANLFSGITITLETKEEAETLWHILNQSNITQEEIYRRVHLRKILPLEKFQEMFSTFWKNLDNAFTPEYK